MLVRMDACVEHLLHVSTYTVYFQYVNIMIIQVRDTSNDRPEWAQVYDVSPLFIVVT